MILNEKELIRFWSYTKKKSIDECWEWNSYKSSGGYGGFYLHNKQMKAHRVSWIIHNGPIPETDSNGNRICVCHKCDNPSCVNPNHLFLGTDLDNMKDRDNKGRRIPFRPIGNKNGNAVIDIQTIKLAEQMLNDGAKNIDVAKSLNISEALTSNIKNGDHWSQRQGST